MEKYLQFNFKQRAAMMTTREEQVELIKHELCSLFDSDAKAVAIVLYTGAYFIVHACDYEEVFDNLSSKVKVVQRVA